MKLDSLRFSLKHAVLVWLLLIGAIGIGTYFHVGRATRYARQQIIEHEQTHVELASRYLIGSLKDVADDMKFLGQLPHLKHVLDSATPPDLADLQADFVEYVRANHAIFQLRWIDRNGVEGVRVDSRDGVVVPIGREQLQDKSKRPYVRRTFELAAGQLYLSRFDLNVEHGAIELPHRPTLRLAAPLFDGMGQRKGMLIINYDGREWLHNLSAGSGASERVMLVDWEGYWLRGPQAADEWGFMARGGPSLASQNPAAWQAISASPQGSVLLEDGLWTWTSLTPAAYLAGGHREFREDQLATVESDAGIWRVLVITPAAALTSESWQVWRQLVPMLGMLVVLATLGAIWLARSRWSIENLNVRLAERASAAEQAARAKSDFLANMSHEIRTPLNAILGLAYLLEKDKLPADSRELVRKLRNSGNTLLRIINDILDFSKIEAGRLQLEFAPFGLSEVLDRLSSVMAAGAGEKALELVIAPPPVGIEQLRGDVLRLEQVLINLASNAIKFTERGHVDVDIDVVDRVADLVTLRFAVRDTGTGISPEKQDEIFSAFSQADTSTTRRFGGTGLGLTISRRLVEMMGGELGLESQPGHGSTFWFTVPFQLEPGPRYAQPEMAGLRVLIVEDDDVARRALQSIAGNLGWHVCAVASGGEAIDEVSARRGRGEATDIILIDWKMPGMDGLDAARRIRAAESDHHEPIIIMVTAFARELLLDHPDSGLADDTLTKPVTPSLLYDAVGRVLHRRGTGDEVTAQASTQRLERLHLLIVDDSEINREVAQRIFTREGATVSLADDGRQALDWLHEHHAEVDLVLMDVQMPIMDGYQATRAIRADSALAALPVVALTAGAFHSQRELAGTAGMDDFISKPFDVDAAIAVILRLAGRSPRAERRPPGDPPAELASPRALPGLQVERGLLLWKDSASYGKYLRRFAKAYRDSATTMSGCGPEDATALAHKLKGAAGNLAMDQVSAAAGRIEEALRSGQDADQAIEDLRIALETALDSIRRYAPAPTEPAVPSASATGGRGKLAALLLQALDAWDSFDPDAVDPLLADLRGMLPPERIAPLYHALEHFDFIGGTQATRTLLESLELANNDE